MIHSNCNFHGDYSHYSLWQVEVVAHVWDVAIGTVVVIVQSIFVQKLSGFVQMKPCPPRHTKNAKDLDENHGGD